MQSADAKLRAILELKKQMQTLMEIQPTATVLAKLLRPRKKL